MGFALSIVSVGQLIILILGQNSEAQLTYSKDACESIMCALYFSYVLFTCTS